MLITEEIKHLKKEKNAVILAHYYVADEVQEIADYIGDSYYLSKAAQKTAADIIVFCGVKFMGESAAILNPEKKVLMPDMTADCAMAHMVQLEKIIFGCVCNLGQCGENCKESAESEYFLYSGWKSGKVCGRTGSGEAYHFQ